MNKVVGITSGTEEVRDLLDKISQLSPENFNLFDTAYVEIRSKKNNELHREAELISTEKRNPSAKISPQPRGKLVKKAISDFIILSRIKKQRNRTYISYTIVHDTLAALLDEMDSSDGENYHKDYAKKRAIVITKLNRMAQRVDGKPDTEVIKIIERGQRLTLGPAGEAQLDKLRHDAEVVKVAKQVEQFIRESDKSSNLLLTLGKHTPAREPATAYY